MPSPTPMPALARPGSPRPDPAADWLSDALADEMTPVIAALPRNAAFALATLVARDGGPRPVGSQMVVTADRRWGFLSGGCVEDDIASHARAALRDGLPRALTYGQGSPFFDIRLPCGGRIDLLVEPMPAGDPAIARLLDLAAQRRPARYLSDGTARVCLPLGGSPAPTPTGGWIVDRTDTPVQRLIVVGTDPFGLAMALAGAQQGWPVWLVGEGLPQGILPDGIVATGLPPAAALDATAPDAWTAVAVATHDHDVGEAALAAALASGAGYVGALGSRRRLEARRRTLVDAGVPQDALDRLRAPIGLPIDARSPRAVAVAVVAEIIAARSRTLA